MGARAGKPRTGRTIYAELGTTFTQADVSDGLTAALRGRLEHVRPFAAEESAQGRAAETCARFASAHARTPGKTGAHPIPAGEAGQH